mgnify:CR=1 FL=1
MNLSVQSSGGQSPASKGSVARSLLKIPFSVIVIFAVALGFLLGYLLPENTVLMMIAVSGTYFPKTIVTFATVIIFFLLAGATAKLITVHKEKAGVFFSTTFIVYVVLGLISLIWVMGFIAMFIKIPMFTGAGQEYTASLLLGSIGNSFKTIGMQPLLHVLFAALLVGWVTTRVKALSPISEGIMKASEKILGFFKWIMWYYPIMIGCLSIYVPMKFGAKGIVHYAQTFLWEVIVTTAWCLVLILATKLMTKRTWKQILSYFWTIYPIGFGTGGSYDTLAANIVSAEKELGLSKEVAEVSIVFGTVLNKNGATMAVMLCTVSVCSMLNIPLSLFDMMMLVLPIWILGLESPGVAGGAGFFMSPIIANILHVPDPALFVTSFLAMYSGVTPMIAVATNTTNDGLIGAWLEDRYAKSLLANLQS